MTSTQLSLEENFSFDPPVFAAAAVPTQTASLLFLGEKNFKPILEYNIDTIFFFALTPVLLQLVF